MAALMMRLASTFLVKDVLPLDRSVFMPFYRRAKVSPFSPVYCLVTPILYHECGRHAVREVRSVSKREISQLI